MRATKKQLKSNPNLLYLNRQRGRPLNFFTASPRSPGAASSAPSAAAAPVINFPKARDNISISSMALPVTAQSSIILPKDDQVRLMIFENNSAVDMYIAFDAEATIYGKALPANSGFVLDYPNAPVNSVSAIAPGAVGTVFLSVQVGK